MTVGNDADHGGAGIDDGPTGQEAEPGLGVQKREGLNYWNASSVEGEGDHAGVQGGDDRPDDAVGRDRPRGAGADLHHRPVDRGDRWAGPGQPEPFD